MNTAIDPKDTQPHYQQGPHALSRRLNQANDRGYVGQETVGQLQEDLHKFRQRCETYKALVVAIAEDDRPLAGVRAARLLQAGWAPSKVLGHLCDAWSMQSWDAQDRDAAALAALGVGGPKLLQALNNAGYLPSYDTGRRHVEGAPRVRPNEMLGLPWLLKALGHIPGCHVWHLCIDEIHVEDVITVSREADCALRVADTPCRWLVALMCRLLHSSCSWSRMQIHTTPPTRRQWCFWLLIQRRGTPPSVCGSSPPAAGSRQSIAMLLGNTWLSCAAMQHFGTATVFSCPPIRTVTHGAPVRCKRRCMLRVLAPSPRCLRFHTFHSKRMSSECVGTLTPPT